MDLIGPEVPQQMIDTLQTRFLVTAILEVDRRQAFTRVGVDEGQGSPIGRVRMSRTHWCQGQCHEARPSQEAASIKADAGRPVARLGHIVTAWVWSVCIITKQPAAFPRRSSHAARALLRSAIIDTLYRKHQINQ